MCGLISRLLREWRFSRWKQLIFLNDWTAGSGPRTITIWIRVNCSLFAHFLSFSQNGGEYYFWIGWDREKGRVERDGEHKYHWIKFKGCNIWEVTLGVTWTWTHLIKFTQTKFYKCGHTCGQTQLVCYGFHKRLKKFWDQSFVIMVVFIHLCQLKSTNFDKY